MRFSRAVATTFGVRVLLVGLGLVSSVLTARFLGPQGRGILATLGALVGIGIQLGNLGLHTSNTYQVSRDPKRMGSLWANSRRAAAGMGLVLSLCTLGLVVFFPAVIGEIRFFLLLLAALGIPFQLLNLFGLNLVVGAGRLAVFNTLELLLRTAYVSGLFLCLVILAGKTRDVLVLNLLMAVAGTLIIGRVLGKLVREQGADPAKMDLALLRESIGYGSKAYLAALLAFLIVRSDMLLVNALRGSAEAGVYSIAVQVVDLIYLLPMSVGLVLFPTLARDDRGDPVFAQKVTRHTAFLLLLLCTAAAVLCKPAVAFLYGDEFSGAVPALWWLLPGIWAYGVANQIGTHLASVGMPASAVWVWVPPLVLNVLLNLLWIPRWGIQGAAVSSTISYGLVLILHLAVWKGRIRGTVLDALVLRGSELRELPWLKRMAGWS